MPLALSKTARTLNSWAPSSNGEIAIVGVKGLFKKDLERSPSELLPDPVYLPQKMPGKYNINNNNVLSTDSSARRQQHRRMKSAALQAIELNLAPYRHGVTNMGFAQEPKPKDSPVFKKQHVSQPSVATSEIVLSAVGDRDPTSVSPSFAPVPSQINTNVHYGGPAANTKRRRFSIAGVATPVRSVCPDASVQCASALCLATGSPQSIGHLRKWNSQTHLGAASQDLPADPDLHVPERQTLRRNASLPDLRLAEQLDVTRVHRARPRTHPTSLPIEEQAPLMRSPSDTGRALCFWMEGEEGIRAFHDLPAARRTKYEQKIALYRKQQGIEVSSITSPSKLLRPSQNSSSKGYHNEDLSSFSPRTLAQELTLLGRELLLAVEPAELVTYVMKPRMAEMETCPNLHRLLQFYDRLAALVASQILESQTSSKRAQTLAMFIEAADRCFALQNWQSCRALLSGIRSPPIVRLKETWAQLRGEYPDHYSMFEMLLQECPRQENSPNETEDGRPRPLAAIPFFGDIVARVRARPTVRRLKPPRALWKESPSLAKWVDEQTSGATECDQCQSRMHKNRACCYLVSFVLGKNFFCPIRRMPPDLHTDHNTNNNNSLHDSSADLAADAKFLQRLHLAQLFDDPESLPFTSRLVQCCALQPGTILDVRQRAEIFLRSAQATSRAYDLESNPTARHYWLHQPYFGMSFCMKRSMIVEPLTTVANGTKRFFV